MTRFLFKCCLIVCLVFVPAMASFGLEPLRSQRETLSHRLIPTQKRQAGSRPSLEDFTSPELLDLIREYQQLQRAQAADQQTREADRPLPRPHFSATPLPEMLPPETRELVQQLAEGTGESIAPDMLDDIADVTEQLNRTLQRQLPEGTTIPRQSIPLPKMVESPRFFQQMIEAIQREQGQAHQAYQRAMQQYRNAWPSDGIPPRDWIQKVQPFINKELVRQLAEARKEVSKGPANGNSSLSRSSEHSSSGYTPAAATYPKSKHHSSNMVESLIKAFDTKSTALIKAATKRKPDRQQSWWKSLRAKSKSKLSAWNKKLTRNSKTVTRQRSRDLNAGLSAARKIGPERSSAASGGHSSMWIIGLLLLVVVAVAALAVYNRSYYSLGRAERLRQIDVAVIHDRDTLLRACHQLATRLFGISSRFWNHRQLFSNLADTVDVERQAVRKLEGIYEHARYAADGRSLSEEDLQLARNLFAGIENSAAVTS